ncbi:MAG TPA: hypothetical protein VLG44_06670 [Chlamydiales bacterium]|nr:hypothetical protein [Chlamydiales bacterium]
MASLVSLLSAQSKVEDPLLSKWARAAIGFIEKHIRWVPNDPDRHGLVKKLLNFRDIWKEIVEAHQKTSARLLAKIQEETPETKENPLDPGHLKRIDIRAESAMKTSIATCQNLCALGFKFLKEHSNVKRIDFYKITSGDHCFLVLGNSPEPNEQDRICDLWGRKEFLFSEKDQKLFDYKGINKHLKPILRKFDPNTQSVTLVIRFIRN